jgi:2'-5' RNA ligase
MRTFLAVSPPLEKARELYAARVVLRDAWTGIRWAACEHFHITLVFLGEQDDTVIETVKNAVGPALEGCEAFDIGFVGAGCFGPSVRPKFFIEKLGAGRDGLQSLNAALCPVLENLVGWEQRPYRPHLTLGRSRRQGVKGPNGGELLPSAVKTDNVDTFRAREVVLYQSILYPDGARYTPLESWPLKEAS